MPEPVLVPGVVRLRPDDQFMILAETDAQPTHVGALLLLAADDGGGHERLRAHLAARLPGTPLQSRLLEAPDGYDSDVWQDLARIDLDHHLVRVAHEGPWREAELLAQVAALSLRRLDLRRAPFRIFIFDAVADRRAALYVQSHHALADGIGFQTILGLLSDAAPPAPPRAQDGVLPDDAWRRLADARFAREAAARAAHAERRSEALAQLEALKADPVTRRPRTPTLKMSGPTSAMRAYATVSLPFARVKSTAKALGGTINDLFLALGSTAVRRLLIELDDLPETPIVANSARSYRRPEHGLFGNRIVALHPHLATHLADPLQRLRAIQAEMRRELSRSAADEAMLDQPERPYGARDRRAKFAARNDGAEPRLPGNVTLSNVPGPAEQLSYAGLPLLANYPVPIIGAGRFLNITSRRNAERLDLGVMADPTRIPDVERVARLLVEALDTYEALA